MNEEFEIKGNRISIYGSAESIKEAKAVLEKHINELTGFEGKDRLIIQSIIDNEKIKADILYNGNTIWSYEKTIRDFKKLLKNGMNAMTDYLYQFLSLETGSIAHYDKQGWISIYSNIASLKEYFKENEYGSNALDFQPGWATDRKKIIKEMFNLLKIT